MAYERAERSACVTKTRQMDLQGETRIGNPAGLLGATYLAEVEPGNRSGLDPVSRVEPALERFWYGRQLDVAPRLLRLPVSAVSSAEARSAELLKKSGNSTPEDSGCSGSVRLKLLTRLVLGCPLRNPAGARKLRRSAQD